MITQTFYFESPQTVPFKNLAFEAYLLETVPEGGITMYLWQNHRTVVIGRNQNPWGECKAEALEEDGGYMVRRLSGGGAVYHDVQNLNFTFLVNQEDYDLERQLNVIIQGVKRFGLAAEKSGRNDILIDGRKFSGNAFYHSGKKMYHHGTILVDVDTEAMSRYLTISVKKLQSKGVESVKSRVVNLKELAPDLTIPELKVALLAAFEEVYGHKAQVLEMKDMNMARIEELETEFGSWDWRFGRKVPLTAKFEERFAWGGVELGLEVSAGLVHEAQIYTDAMDFDLFNAVPEALKGQVFESKTLCACIEKLKNESNAVMMDDLAEMIRNGVTKD